MSHIQFIRYILKVKNICKRVGNIVYYGILNIIVCILIWLVLLITTYDTFHVPSASMFPTILPNDCGVINKWRLGGRIFDVISAVKGDNCRIYRLPGYSELKRGDIIIFNGTAPKNWDTLRLDMKRYYCKRAVAVSGDTLEVIDGFYRIRGYSKIIGNIAEQEKLKKLSDYYRNHTSEGTDFPHWFYCAPYDTAFNWRIDSMGPLVIPAKGMRVKMDRHNFGLYRKYIEYETMGIVEWKNGNVLIDGKKRSVYTFQENYFFAAGDFVSDSQDSRYWGLVPEKHIVGVACFIWKSPLRRRYFHKL